MSEHAGKNESGRKRPAARRAESEAVAKSASKTAAKTAIKKADKSKPLGKKAAEAKADPVTARDARVRTEAPKPSKKVRARAQAPAPAVAAVGSSAEADTSAFALRQDPERVVPVYEPERDLDALLGDVRSADGDAEARRRAAEAISHIAARLAPERDHAGPERPMLLPRARQYLRTDFYLRRLGELGMRNRSEHIDDFGLDPTYEARVRPFFEMICTKYFRVQIEGAEYVPDEGRALLVCNHSGTLPWDGVMLRTALRMHHRRERALRWLAEDFVFHAPFLGAFVNRIGAVRACQENAERLLGRDELVAVFPEGIKGIGKRFTQRYKLQRFGRGGHIKLALRTGTPVIPVAIVGAEETYPLLHKVTAFSQALGVPFLPVTPTFPWLGPLGAAPLPSRWQIVIGEPTRALSDYGPDAASDEVLVNELNERVRAEVQSLLSVALERRGPRAWL